MSEMRAQPTIQVAQAGLEHALADKNKADALTAKLAPRLGVSLDDPKLGEQQLGLLLTKLLSDPGAQQRFISEFAGASEELGLAAPTAGTSPDGRTAHHFIGERRLRIPLLLTYRTSGGRRPPEISPQISTPVTRHVSPTGARLPPYSIT
jgi:hypothetical protein